jgi:hypothetical protein
MAQPGHARVDRAVDGDTVPTQRAARGDKVPKAGTGRWRLRCRGRSLRDHGFIGRGVGRIYDTSETKNHRCNSIQSSHINPLSRPILIGRQAKVSTQQLTYGDWISGITHARRTIKSGADLAPEALKAHLVPSVRIPTLFGYSYLNSENQRMTPTLHTLAVTFQRNAASCTSFLYWPNPSPQRSLSSVIAMKKKASQDFPVLVRSARRDRRMASGHSPGCTRIQSEAERPLHASQSR